MKCQTVRQLLVGYLDDELSKDDLVLVKEHLAVCSACQQEFGMAWNLESRLRRTLQELAVAFEPSPSSPDRIQARLAASQTPRAAFPNARWTWALQPLRVRMLAAVAIAAIVVSVAGLVSPVRAAVLEAVGTWFRLPMAGSNSGVVVPDEIVPFRPIAPAYWPEDYHNSMMYSGGEPGAEALEIRMFSAERFVIIFEHQTPESRDLPDGEDVLIDGQPGILLTEQSGTAHIMLPAPQPQHAHLFQGVGGGGGGGTDLRETLPDTISYQNGVRIVWYVGDTRVELLSNEPLDEVLRVADSMTPVEIVDEPLALPSPPEHLVEDGSQTAPDALPGSSEYLFPTSDGGEIRVSADFTPLAPTYWPFDIMGGGGGGDGQVLELAFTDGTVFLEITQQPGGDGESASDGGPVTINGEPAVLVTGLGGTFDIGQPGSPIVYSNGTSLTWEVDEVELTLLSNLPQEEVVKIAESMEKTRPASSP